MADPRRRRIGSGHVPKPARGMVGLMTGGVNTVATVERVPVFVLFCPIVRPRQLREILMRLQTVLACLFLVSTVILVPTLMTADEPPSPPITPAEAAKRPKEKVTVEMLVRSTGGRENCYLNSEDDFKLEANFTVFIPKDAKEKFKKAGVEDPATHFKQKTIHVTGIVILVEKKPRIAVTEPAQIKVVDKNKKP
jgi:DNA/RNA endonuclease YhcR with UshA esterase domain